MWVVDTCVIIDILEGDPSFGVASARCLTSYLSFGLVLAPVSYVELAPTFGGSKSRQEAFLNGVGIHYAEPWMQEDTLEAHRAWCRHQERKRAGLVKRRPVADVLIGAYAQRRHGLITRNEKDFRLLYPKLNVHVPLPILYGTERRTPGARGCVCRWRARKRCGGKGGCPL